MNHHELLNTATRLGYLLLANGAETYRVEESIQHIIRAYGVKEVDVFAIPTTIIVTITTNKELSITKTKRLSSRSINLDKVDQLNQLSRYICAEKPDMKKIQEKLNEINERPVFSFGVQVFAYSLASFSFTLFFGGSLLDALCAIVLGAIVRCVTNILEKAQTNSFFTTIIASFTLAALSIFCVRFHFGHHVDKIIIGTFMTLVPGVAITNSIRDIIAGDYLSGQTRMIDAVLTATAIALGSGIALAIFQIQ